MSFKSKPARPQDAQEVRSLLTKGEWVWYKPFMRSYEIHEDTDGTYYVQDTDCYVSSGNTIDQVTEFIKNYDASKINDFE